jgi:hypothetical protein
MAQIEGQIALVAFAYQQGQIKSIRAIAKVFEVPRNILVCRTRGILPRVEIIPYNRKLTTTKESTIIDWIIDIDIYRLLSTQALVRRTAELLLRGQYTNALNLLALLGKQWVFNFIKY